MTVMSVLDSDTVFSVWSSLLCFELVLIHLNSSPSSHVSLPLDCYVSGPHHCDELGFTDPKSSITNIILNASDFLS